MTISLLITRRFIEIYHTNPYEKLLFDLLYINNISIMTDLELMFATAAILFLPESTEGVAAGQTTAIIEKMSSWHWKKKQYLKATPTDQLNNRVQIAGRAIGGRS